MAQKSIKQVLKQSMHKLQLQKCIGHAEDARTALLLKKDLLQKYLADQSSDISSYQEESVQQKSYEIKVNQAVKKNEVPRWSIDLNDDGTSLKKKETFGDLADYKELKTETIQVQKQPTQQILEEHPQPISHINQPQQTRIPISKQQDQLQQMLHEQQGQLQYQLHNQQEGILTAGFQSIQDQQKTHPVWLQNHDQMAAQPMKKDYTSDQDPLFLQLTDQTPQQQARKARKLQLLEKKRQERLLSKEKKKSKQKQKQRSKEHSKEKRIPQQSQQISKCQISEVETIQIKDNTRENHDPTVASDFWQDGSKLHKYSDKEEGIASRFYKGVDKEEESMPIKRRKQPVSMLAASPSVQKKMPVINKLSNSKLMLNALKSLLPGQINRSQRQKLMQMIESKPEEYYIFLFKDKGRLALKGGYFLQDRVIYKAWGNGPQQITQSDIRVYYRYDSGAREFRIVQGCQHISLAVNGVVLV